MGVIRHQNNRFDENERDTLDDIIEQSLLEIQELSYSNVRSKAKRVTKPESFKPPHYRPKSARKRHRYESAEELMMSADPEDLDELTIEHFMSNNVSAFAKLMSEKENMRYWNEFINTTEEAQEEMINGIDKSGAKNQSKFPKEESKKHPAYSPKQCFENIDKMLRQMIKKHAPIGLIENLEDALVSFFTLNPNEIYDCHLPSSYDRLILHAVAQYHYLHSTSYDMKGKRRTKVKNSNETIQSHIPMHRFLEMLNPKSN